MLYAKVVLGLPVDGSFDYQVAQELENKVSVGARVWVNFRNKKEVAYVVGLGNKTSIKKIKNILALIDEVPVLSEQMLLLTKRLAEYYCCSWGEAIETALPEELRKGKKWGQIYFSGPKAGKINLTPFFVQGQERFGVYLREIKEALSFKRSAVLLFSDIPEATRAKELIEDNLGIQVFIAFRKQQKEQAVWEEIRQKQFCLVVGTRSNIFSPVNNLGLIIIDQENDQVYKQEQVPHYHARQVALMRAEIEGAKLIFAGSSLSLECFYLAQKNKVEYEFIPPKLAYPEVKVIDLRRLAYADRKSKSIFSKFLADAIYTALNEKGKVLLFINRKGFATSASCHNCGLALKCPRCNINLVFHFDENKLKCHHCNFKMEMPGICPSCKAGYIKYSGLGTEKVESELARIFPQARIQIIDDIKCGLSNADIFVSTSAVMKHQNLNFDLIGVLAIDNSLNRLDFRSSEKTFALLMNLTNFTSKKIIIQSANSNHYCFRALIKNEPKLFFREELAERKQLNFPPFKHLILLKIRGPSLDKVKKSSQDLFERLSKIKTSSIKLLSLNCGQPAKLRGNFYYQILMRSSSPEKASSFLKLHLKEYHFSGIITTVDVDPV
ncbi:MAG: primosomal protein N' [Candidatus Omnitrophica bacterium]|nr:primosomal protein N' [Candidatus Omnitrophota bacterium]MDD5660382.1 primosomal protein N' [Candidatus Omnitrophota bacterium]